MELKAGLRLKSAVCETEVIIVRPATGDVDLRCGGTPMTPQEEAAGPRGSVAPEHDGGTLLGKRYASEALGLELLCTKPGKGSLSIGDEPLGLKEAKPLPSSD